MMNQLVLVVEDDPMINGMLTGILKKNGISFISASNLLDATELFRTNRTNISYIALDGTLRGKFCLDYPETLSLASVIAHSNDFQGVVFPMSTIPAHNGILQEELGDKCVLLDCESMMIKFKTILEIVKRVLEK